MDSHPLFPDAARSSSASFADAPRMPNSLCGSAESCTRDSPDLSFSTRFDSAGSSLESNGCFRSTPTIEGSSTSRPKNEDDPWSMSHGTRELEAVLVGPKGQVQNESPWSLSPLGMIPAYWGSRPDWPQGRLSDEFTMASREELLYHDVPPESLKKLLIACAISLSENSIDEFDKLVERARRVVSITGEPIERVGAYMVDALVARKEKSGRNIYRALRCGEPESKDLLSYTSILYEICPYLKFSYMAANGAIAEACRAEERIHIVDFMITQGTQWMSLLQALAARPGGPPRVRITGIDDPVSLYARGAGLDAVGRRLNEVSAKFRIPVEFRGIPVFAPEVTTEMLATQSGEALVVNFPLQLHRTPDESVDVSNPRDGLLRLVKSLSPKLVTLVEQESNTNTTPFITRFAETLDHYAAMFESVEGTMRRNQMERINVERNCLARDIVNIIACEGKGRVERHELLGKWKSRFAMAGFRQYPLSGYVNSVIGRLLGGYSPHYKLVERDGAMLLGWKDRFLVSASAWR